MRVYEEPLPADVKNLTEGIYASGCSLRWREGALKDDVAYRFLRGRVKREFFVERHLHPLEIFVVPAQTGHLASSGDRLPPPPRPAPRWTDGPDGDLR